MENKEPILLRVEMILKDKQMSETAFAKSIGMSQRTINNYLKGYNRPTLSFAERILDAYPDLSAEWLLRGVGEMYLSQPCDEGGGGSASCITNEDIGKRLQSLQEELNNLKEKIC